MRSRALVLGVVGAVCLALVSGCTRPASEQSPPPQVSENAPAQINLDELPDDVSAEGVIVAALILKNGDITRAVEEALVSPAEVEYAREAIRNGTLQLWVDAAVMP